MDSTIEQLGLNENESSTYLYLLENGATTAANIAKKIGESRTNMYMILDSLEELGLVLIDNSKPVRQFVAADPQTLKKLLVAQQQQIRQSQLALHQIMPQLSSMYNLSQHKPGVVYYEGVEGFKALFEDMIRTNATSDIIGSDFGPLSNEVWDIILKGNAKRKAKGTHSRIIFHKGAKKWPHIGSFEKRGLETRLWGDLPREGEITVYSNKVAFTTFHPDIVVMVMTNDVMAHTFRNIFEEIWQAAEPINTKTDKRKQ